MPTQTDAHGLPTTDDPLQVRVRPMPNNGHLGAVELIPMRAEDGGIEDFCIDRVIAPTSSTIDVARLQGRRLTAAFASVAPAHMLILQQAWQGGAPVTVSLDAGGRSFEVVIQAAAGHLCLLWIETANGAHGQIETAPNGEQSAHVRRYYDLTAREQEILRLLAAGSSTEAMAKQLHLSPFTVRNHVRRLLARLGASSRLEAVVLAVNAGLISVAGPAL